MDEHTTQPSPAAVSPEHVEDVAWTVRHMRSTRAFDDTSLDDGLVAGWLDAARWCGSSRNSQPWRFVVVRDPSSRAALTRLGDHADHLKAAPVVIVVAAVEGPFPFSTAFDLGRVSQSIMLAAAADGVGSCIAVFEPAANIDRARQLLGIPRGMRADLAIGLGRPSDAVSAAAGPSPSAAGRLPFDVLVSQERYGCPFRRGGR